MAGGVAGRMAGSVNGHQAQRGNRQHLPLLERFDPQSGTASPALLPGSLVVPRPMTLPYCRPLFNEQAVQHNCRLS